MGIVTIGGRELRVLEDREDGSFWRDMEVLRVSAEMKDLEGAPLQMKFAEMVHCYVGAPVNEGVTLEWIARHIPSDVHHVLRRCAIAAGRTPKEPPPGEAGSP